MSDLTENILYDKENNTTCFVSREDNKFTMRIRKMVTNKNSDKKWVRFETVARLTVTVKRPAYLLSPTVNLFATGTKFYRTEKSIANFTLNPQHVIERLTTREQDWFLEELTALTSRQNITVNWLKLFTKTSVVSNRRSSRSFFTVTSPVGEIFQNVAYPLIQHVATDDKTIPPILAQILRMDTAENLLHFLGFKSVELNSLIQNWYETSQLTFNSLIILSVTKGVYTDPQILEALNLFHAGKNIPVTVSSTEAQLRGVLRKTPFSVFIDACKGLPVSEPGERTRTEERFPSLNMLTLWGKHYRQLKPVKPLLGGLTDVHLNEYIATHIVGQDALNEDKLLTRLNNLKISEPVSKLSIPAEFSLLFSGISSQRKTNTVVDGHKLYIQYVINNSFLGELLKKHATTGAHSVYDFKFTGWVGIVGFLEELDSYIYGLFSKTSVECSPENIELVMKTFSFMNRSFHSKRFTGKIPLNVLKLYKVGVPYQMATELILNKHSYKEIVDTAIVDGAFSVPKSFLYGVYPCKITVKTLTEPNLEPSSDFTF